MSYTPTNWVNQMNFTPADANRIEQGIKTLDLAFAALTASSLGAVPKAGGTMTGPLVLPVWEGAYNANHAARVGYVDERVENAMAAVDIVQTQISDLDPRVSAGEAASANLEVLDARVGDTEERLTTLESAGGATGLIVYAQGQEGSALPPYLVYDETENKLYYEDGN